MGEKPPFQEGVMTEEPAQERAWGGGAQGSAGRPPPHAGCHAPSRLSLRACPEIDTCWGEKAWP